MGGGGAVGAAPLPAAIPIPTDPRRWLSSLVTALPLPHAPARSTDAGGVDSAGSSLWCYCCPLHRRVINVRLKGWDAGGVDGDGSSLWRWHVHPHD